MVEEKIKMSLLYSIAVALIIVMALAISSMFMTVESGEPFDVIANVLLNTLVILFIFFLCILASVALGFSFLFFRMDYMQARFLEKLAEIANAAAGNGAAPVAVEAEGVEPEDPNLPAVIGFIRSNPKTELDVLIKQLRAAGFREETIKTGVEKVRVGKPGPAPEKK
ncbi:MAG: hypothetical protein QGG50_02100 [Methanopyri archaeon]|jgi:hypothetical protein|nr:hypothetical protein [Methanopyri archaeon]